MLTRERHIIIRNRLAAEGRVLAVQLAAEFNVSEDTVRRDLRDLARQGHCERVYGGAMLRTADVGPIHVRKGENRAEKHALALAAATMVSAGQVVFIDAGSTNVELACALPRDLELTVVTNAPLVANALCDHSLVQVILLGGILDQRRGAALGGITVSAIAAIHADLFFVGTCGLDPIYGLTAFHAAEAEVKRAMANQSNRLCVAATADKLGTRAPFRITGAESVSELISTSNANGQLLDDFRRLGVVTTLVD